jgi:hypothetical protein
VGGFNIVKENASGLKGSRTDAIMLDPDFAASMF